MKSNQEKTIKIPLAVHRALKQLAATRGVTMYCVLAQLLLAEICNQGNNRFATHDGSK